MNVQLPDLAVETEGIFPQSQGDDRPALMTALADRLTDDRPKGGEGCEKFQEVLQM